MIRFSNPGILTPVIWSGPISGNQGKLGWIDYMVGTLRVVVMIWIGVNFDRHRNHMEDNSKGREMDEE